MTRKYASSSSERHHGLRKENVRFKFNYQRSFPEPLSQNLTNRFEVPLRAPTIEVPLRAPTIDVPLRARAAATPKI